MTHASARIICVLVALTLAALPVPALSETGFRGPAELRLPTVAADPDIPMSALAETRPPGRYRSMLSRLLRKKALPPPPDPATLAEAAMPESFDGGEAAPVALDAPKLEERPAIDTEAAIPAPSETAAADALAIEATIEGALAIERAPLADTPPADVGEPSDIVAGVLREPRLPRRRPADSTAIAAVTPTAAAAILEDPRRVDRPPPPAAPAAAMGEVADLKISDPAPAESSQATPEAQAGAPEVEAAATAEVPDQSPPAIASSPESASASLHPAAPQSSESLATTMAAVEPPLPVTAQPAPEAPPPAPVVDEAVPLESVTAAPPVADLAEETHPSGEQTTAEAVVPPPVTEPAPDPVVETMTPRELVQELQVLQDRIALGSTDALVAQRAMLERIERAFAAAPTALWQDRQNAAALVIYVLSGGRPDSLRRALGQEPRPALDENLMRGALAYVEGEEESAKTLLSAFDARSFPASMGSQVAIAQAALAVADEPKRAAALLDIARLLAPGTLAEEAALRREILILAQLQDTDKFAMLSRQYMQRFRHSVYAGNFRQRFAAALTRMTFVDDPAQVARLDDMLADLEPEARRELFLTVARAAVVQARTEAARFAAARALETAPPGTVEEARALLYRAAASAVLADGFDAARADLAAIDQGLLDESDVKLHAVVTAMMESIVADAMPEPPPAEAGVTQAQPGTADASGAAAADAGASDPEQESPAMIRAREAIKVADALLGAQS